MLHFVVFFSILCLITQTFVQNESLRKFQRKSKIGAFVGVFTNKMESDLLVKTSTKAKKAKTDKIQKFSFVSCPSLEFIITGRLGN